MTVSLKLLCPETVGELPDGNYTVPEGSTAAEALACCAALPRERVEGLMFLCNGKHVQPDALLSDGDSLMVLRPLRGG